MKIILVFPPQSQPFMPHLAIPLLKSYLKHKGIDVLVKDFNMEAYEYFLSERFLPAEFLMPLEEAKRKLRSSVDYFIPEDYYKSIEILEKALFYISSTLKGVRWSLKDFIFAPYRTSSSSEIFQAVKDSVNNLFYGFFEEKIKDIEKENPDILGISVAWKSQVIPAFTLAYLIKKHLPFIHICMGGSMIGHLSDYLRYKKSMFSCVDSYLPFDGETGLLKLLEELKGGNLKNVPALIYPEKKKILCNKPQLYEDLNNLPYPDFSDLPLDKYYSPGAYLPVSASRGCYWGKCAFCSHHFSGSKFRSRKPQVIFQEMNFLHETYGAKNFYFVDDAMPPAVMRDLALMIIDGKKSYRWAGEIRFEEIMDRSYFEVLYRGGCRLLLFGLESYSERVLSLMKKGYKRELAPSVVRDASISGIMIWVFFFLGFPGEEQRDAKETLNFILNNREYIDMVGPGPFILTKNSEVHRNLRRFRIRAIGEDRELDLQLTYPALMASGLQREDADKILGEFQNHPGVQKFLKPFVAEPHLLFFQKRFF
ncbi:MAG TPA: radical SAM protein [Candidatus Eremiobacteraeota bacterium]|nr:MAG: Ribosomal protein S12 methylthiotransferase RimO [bacterium ADurb.Bin363]HPZ09215.1 radical SAM protein [Candidatus Eremiobacteraeota bacterium]